jgi:formate-nitrite transporter family protein
MATPAKSAGEILESVVDEGRKELDRASLGLAFSGFAAGLNVSFAALALVIVAAATDSLGLAFAAYPLGFIIVIIGKGQLFTTNTVTPVTVVLTDRSRLSGMLRLWGVVFLFNILGTAVFAAGVHLIDVLDPPALQFLLEDVVSKMDYSFWQVVLRGIFGGWLVALIPWLVAASQDTVSQVLFVWGMVFLIPAGGLPHCIAGSAEVLISVLEGETSLGEYLGAFLIPTTLGNVIGGVVLVTLLNYGQVWGSNRPGKQASSERDKN